MANLIQKDRSFLNIQNFLLFYQIIFLGVEVREGMNNVVVFYFCLVLFPSAPSWMHAATKYSDGMKKLIFSILLW